MRRIAIVLVALVAALAPGPLASAQLGPNVPSPLTEQEPPPPEAPKEEDRGLGLVAKILIFGGAGAIIALIGWMIVRDARRAAPVEQRAPEHGAGRRSAGRDRERDQRRRRARSRAAKQQRKRNRPR